MDSLAEFIGVNKLNQLKRDQLAEQGAADLSMSGLSRICGGTVANFLLAVRERSRGDQYRVLGAGLTGMYAAAVREIISSKEIYERFNDMYDNAVDDYERCNLLDEMVRMDFSVGIVDKKA